MSHLAIYTGYDGTTCRPVEIVERKGLGHPDTLADGIAELISIRYSQFCLEQFGAVLHHNVDKTAIIGGSFVSTAFGHAEMRQPIRVILNGRMSTSFSNQQIDIWSIQETAARDFLRYALPELRPNEHVVFEHFTNDFARYDTWFRPKSFDDLPELKIRVAADASVCVAYWPLTLTEQLVLTLEKHLNNKPRRHSFIGQDIKVLAQRHLNHVSVTIAMPFLSHHTPSEDYYFEKKQEIHKELLELANTVVRGRLSVEIEVNTQEKAPFKSKRIYMLATGSCIEAGEEGVVGRGNTTLGIISVNRPHSMEAPYGKNPVYHSGKVYNYLVRRLSRAVAEEFGCECTIYAISKNGEQLIPPPQVIIQVDAQTVDRQRVEQLVQQNMVDVDYVTDIVYGNALLPVWSWES